MKIYSLRHGQTNMNIKHIYNGLVDEDINETGIKQCEEARDILRSKDIDLIICSPLLRTRHTCEIVNINNIPVIYDNRLLERTLGKFDGTKPEEHGITDEVFYDYFHKYDDDKIEDMPTVFDRAFNLLDEIKEKYKDKNVLLITHGAIMRAIHFYFNGIPEDKNMLVFSSKNCQICEYDFDDMKRKGV